MTWTLLFNQRKARNHVPTLVELTNLRAVVNRDLTDAALEGLSADRRFATAYNAVLQLSTMVVACAGYQVIGERFHETTFEAVKLTMGDGVAALTTYFDSCRRKSHKLESIEANVVGESEVTELLASAAEFKAKVETWITTNRPAFAAA